MSKVLKKITKKYKWLRFLNYKTTKLAVLSAALFGLCLSSGASFAKYRDENYGGENAGVAVFQNGYINDVSAYVQVPTDLTECSVEIHAFIIGFSLTINKMEVSVNTDLSLRLSPDDETNFEYEYSNLNSSLFIENQEYINGDSQLQTFSNGVQTTFDFKNYTGLNLEKNKFYVAESDDGINYSWIPHDVDLQEKDPTKIYAVSIFNKDISANVSYKKYFQFIVFVTPQYTKVGDEITDVWFDQTRILYNLKTIQII